MILDNQTLFSDQQAITASVASTNTIDLGPIASGMIRDIGPGAPISLQIQVTEAFNNLTSLAVAIQVDDNSAFSSATTVVTSAAIGPALLLPGYRFLMDFIPRLVNERYVRLFYTVVGTAPTTGKITAGVVLRVVE